MNALNSSVSDYNAQLETLKTAVAALDASGSEYAAALDNIKDKLNEKLTALTNEASAVTDVMSKIDSLNTSSNLVQDMLDARSAYNALPSAAKSRVTNIKVLTDFEKSHKAVVNVISLFEKLDPSSKSYISKAKSAFTAYAKLDDNNKVYVKNYKDLKDIVPVVDVIVQITALNPSKKTYKVDVTKATETYAALADATLQGKVVNYADLIKAQGYIDTAKNFDARVAALANENPDTFVKKVADLAAEYKTMDKNVKKLVEEYKTLSAYEKNNKAVVKVIQMIDALNPTSKDYTKRYLLLAKPIMHLIQYLKNE